ncbi:hypothetical protein U1Q18_049628, partial [Sarracenia purpurea var. burkii]
MMNRGSALALPKGIESSVNVRERGKTKQEIDSSPAALTVSLGRNDSCEIPSVTKVHSTGIETGDKEDEGGDGAFDEESEDDNGVGSSSGESSSEQEEAERESEPGQSLAEEVGNDEALGTRIKGFGNKSDNGNLEQDEVVGGPLGAAHKLQNVVPQAPCSWADIVASSHKPKRP